MIEIIYNETNETGRRVIIKPPKNIRQMGISDGKKKIYIEDYVYTYLHQMGKRSRRPSIAILLGKSEQSDGIQYSFISGAVSCEGIMMDSEKIVFTQQAWTVIYERMKEHFDGQEIVGWFFTKAGILLEVTPNIQSAHLNYFPGVDKVFWMFEPEKGEEKLFLYDYGQLRALTGFYIYYEKNPQMQEYMIKHNQRELPVEKKQAEDEAIRNYRKLMQEKEEEKEHQQHKRVNLLGVLSCLTFIALAIVGINMINSYEKMRDMEAVLSQISKTVESVSADMQEQNEENDSVTVQSVESTVQKQTEETTEQNTSQETEITTDSAASSETQDASDSTVSQETQNSAQQTQSNNDQTEAYYVVQEGDSLETICQKLYNTCNVLDELCQINGIEDKDTIYVGQKLKLI